MKFLKNATRKYQIMFHKNRSPQNLYAITMVASLCLLELGCLHLQLFFTISLLAEQTCKLFAFPRACPFPTSSVEGFTYLMKLQMNYFQSVKFRLPYLTDFSAQQYGNLKFPFKSFTRMIHKRTFLKIINL